MIVLMRLSSTELFRQKLAREGPTVHSLTAGMIACTFDSVKSGTILKNAGIERERLGPMSV